MLNYICFYFLLFIIYANLGWIMEVVGKLIEKHKFINRGFLIGPICPIYGWGCIILIILLSKYKSDPLLLFFMAILICSILEYFTSYFMEKIFHARWWDYTKNKYNINGRICVNTMIPFGILGCSVIYLINPFFMSILLKLDTSILNIIAILIFIIFLIDNVISFSIISNFSNTLKTLEKDGTEEITKKVKEILLRKDIFHRRLIKAFPTLLSNKERLLFLKNKINNELSKIDKKLRN